jgi:hypothetical protein
MNRWRQRTLFEWRELEVMPNKAHEFRIRCRFAVLTIVTSCVLELDENICSGASKVVRRNTYVGLARVIHDFDDRVRELANADFIMLVN